MTPWITCSASNPVSPAPEKAQHKRPHAFYIVVEKILAPGETLPKAWPVAGTTGYDFLNQVNGIFIREAGIAKTDRDLDRVCGDQRLT